MSEVRPLAAFDLDGTLFKTSMLDGVFAVARSKGIIADKDAETVDEANDIWLHGLNTEDSYQDSVGLTVRALMRAFEGKTPTDLKQIAREAANRRLRKRRFVHEAMQLLGESHEVVIISASHVNITRTFLKAYDIHPARIFGSNWEIIAGKFTTNGRTIDKPQVVQSLVKAGSVQLEGSCAFGDTISDLGMLDAVEVGVMVNPSATLERAGRDRHHKVRESKDNISHTLPSNNQTSYEYPVQTTEGILRRVGLL